MITKLQKLAGYSLGILAVFIMFGFVYWYAHEEPVEPMQFGAIEVSIDGETKSIAYTDENEGEDLIIKSDQENYFNFGGSITVHFSIFNSSKEDQNIKTAFSFSDGTTKYVKNLYEYDGEEIEKYTPPPYFDNTTTDSMIFPKEEFREVTKWKELALQDFTTKTIERKDLKDTEPQKEATLFIKSGETKFLKADINFTDLKGQEEFFIEAFGDKGSYGHLDPFTYEQDFNALNTGDLNGQDGWSGDALYDVVTDADSRYDDAGTGSGAKGVKIITPNTSGYGIDKSVTAVTAGTLYVAMRNTAQAGEMGMYLRQSATYMYFLGLGTANAIFNGAVGNVLISGYTADQWYVFAVEIDGAGHRAKAKIHDGDDWSSWSSWTNGGGGSLSSISTIAFRAADGASTYYFDSISPDDITIAAPVILDDSGSQPVIWFD